MSTREVPCPRCHEPCGWCSDYRHMHGVLKLPGSKRRCGVKGFEPEGSACPMCHGSQRVLQTVTYTSLPSKRDISGGQAVVPDPTGIVRDNPLSSLTNQDRSTTVEGE